METISSKQLKANRLNANLGGVKTPGGKDISKYNATKHSILTNKLISEESALASELTANLCTEYEPQTSIEHLLVERIAIWQVRLIRAVAAEAEKLQQISNPRIVRDYFEFASETVVQEGYKPAITDDDVSQLLQTYLRYEVSIERNLMRAINSLLVVQQARKDKNGFVSQK